MTSSVPLLSSFDVIKESEPRMVIISRLSTMEQRSREVHQEITGEDVTGWKLE